MVKLDIVPDTTHAPAAAEGVFARLLQHGLQSRERDLDRVKARAVYPRIATPQLSDNVVLPTARMRRRRGSQRAPSQSMRRS